MIFTEVMLELRLRYVLTKLRLDAGLLQKQLRLGGNIWVVSEIERGDRKPTLHTIQQYAEFFNVSVGDIIKGAEAVDEDTLRNFKR